MHSDKKIYCSAGISHVVIAPSGNVYRCMNDYNLKRRPLFNIKNGWRPMDVPELCLHENCDSYCDLDWATKWITGKDGRVIESHRAGCERYLPPEKGSLFANQTLKDPLRKVIHIIWFPTILCNYRCSYCGIEGRVEDPSFTYPGPELSQDEWLKAWNEIYNTYDYGVVSITGGEPFLAKSMIPVTALISDKFWIDITSNLSVRTNVMKIVKSGIKPGQNTGIRFITGSLHPAARGFNKDFFLGSLLYLKNHGYPVGVNFVGHPLQLFLTIEYKEYFEKHGIPFVFSSWRGGDADGFVAKYSEIEKKFIDNLIQQDIAARNEIIEFDSYKCDITADKSAFNLERGATAVLQGRIKNSGLSLWSNAGLREERFFKIGARLVRYGDEKNTLMEYRGLLAEAEMPPGKTCDFRIDINTKDISDGIYLLKLDMVKECDFWFEDKGGDPLKVRLHIAKKTC